MSAASHRPSRRNRLMRKALTSFSDLAKGIRISPRLEDAPAWFLILVLIWAPFPLGSNRAWSWSLLAVLVGIAWLRWVALEWKRPETVLNQIRPILPALVLAALPLAWGIVQILPIVPQSFVHPVWSIASEGLGKKLPGTISIDPWRTETELMKLGTYAMTAWLFYALSLDRTRARLLFNAIIAIGIFYALYAWLFAAMNWHQFSVFYSVPDIGNRLASPFINKNSLADYVGLISLCCALKLSEKASANIGSQKNVSRALLRVIQFAFGSGTVYVLLFLISFGLMVATGSLGGSVATVAAFGVMIAVSVAGLVRSKLDTVSTVLGVALLGSVVAFFMVAGGGELGTKVMNAAQGGFDVNLRVTLWTAAERMIRDSPVLGMGLGTYQQAYPLYEDTFLPYIMDKAHNDYLELAAGWGIPAAASWLAAIGWLVWMCFRGAFVRQRDRIFALLGLSAAVLVGVHSLFDFPLQIPAIAFLFSALIGLGAAQSLPTEARAEAKRSRGRIG